MILLSFCGPVSCVKPQEGDPEVKPGTDDQSEDTSTPTFVIKTLSGDETDFMLFSQSGGNNALMVQTTLKDDEWSVEGGDSWCRVVKEDGLIRLTVDPYGESNERLYPRSCTFLVKSKLFNEKTITVVQEGDTYITTIPNLQKFTLSPSGTPLDIFIDTNFYEWKVKNDNEWFTVEQPDRMTLRVKAQPKADGDDTVRSGSIILYSAAWPEEDLEIRFGSRIVRLYFQDGDPGLSGEDFNYGDKHDWD